MPLRQLRKELSSIRPASGTWTSPLYKNFQLRENTRLQFRSEFFNFTNTPYFGAPNGISFQSINSLVPDGPRNGEIRSLRTPMRIVQFTLKLSF